MFFMVSVHTLFGNKEVFSCIFVSMYIFSASDIVGCLAGLSYDMTVHAIAHIIPKAPKIV